MMIRISMLMMLRMIMMMTADLGKMYIGADLVDNANLLQEKGIKSFMITMMMMLRMIMMMPAAA